MSKNEMLKKLFNDNGFTFFESGEYNMNLFGVRKDVARVDEFDDIICTAYKTDKGWSTIAMTATTDPGATVLGRDRMGNKHGTAILPTSTIKGFNQQYKFKLGTHRNKYPALNQAEPFTIVRDSDTNGMLMTHEEIEECFVVGNTFTGYFGINMHHASSIRDSTRVGNWSHGCQVIRNIFQWTTFWNSIKRSSSTYGDKFTYTLFSEDDIIDSTGLSVDEFKKVLNK